MNQIKQVGAACAILLAVQGAHAQFVVSDQSGWASASANCAIGCTPQSFGGSVPAGGALDPFNLSFNAAQTNEYGGTATAAGGASANYTAGMIRVSVGASAEYVGVWQAPRDPWFPAAQSAQASAGGSVTLNFTVEQDTWVNATVTDLYRSSSISLSRLASDGSIQPIYFDLSGNYGVNYGGQINLVDAPLLMQAGNYKILASVGVSPGTGISSPGLTQGQRLYDGAGSLMVLTAVPEPSSFIMLGLGLAGVVLVSRRSRRTVEA